jgi:Caspase domain
VTVEPYWLANEKPSRCQSLTDWVSMLRMFSTLWRCAVGLAVCGLHFSLVAVSSAPAAAETRHALVVGNDIYAELPHLMKARNDARAVEEALRQTGFTTNLVLDADQTPFLEAFSNFAQTINPGVVALFYYAGHGIEIDGQNYLLLTDAPDVNAGQELVLTSRAVPVASLLETLTRRGARASIFILDACRDNPFRGRTTRGLGGTRGLAPVSADGTFILYSAGTGQAALDRLSDGDDNPNSVFTRALVPLLTTPGLSIRDITNAVRSDVRRLARSVGYDQFPAYYDEMEGDLEFVAAAAEIPAEPLPPDPCNAARADWAAVRDANDPQALVAYISAYDMCPVQTALATAMLNRLNQEMKKAAPDDVQVAATAPLPPTEPDPQAETPSEPLPEPDASISLATLAHETQTELKRLGCYDGEIDGIWGKGSQKALGSFAQHSGMKIDAPTPTLDLLAALQPLTGRICPLECGPKYLVVNDTCQLKTCATGSGLVLDSKGLCSPPKKSTAKPRAAAKSCFSFEGQGVCE